MAERALPKLTVLIEYQLIGSEAAFRTAISKLVARVQTAGHPGVLSYRFFVNPGAASARAVVDYASPDAWIGHHDISMAWPEMTAMHQVARLTCVTFLGPLTTEIENWISGSNLNVQLDSGHDFAAGFQR